MCCEIEIALAPKAKMKTERLMYAEDVSAMNREFQVTIVPVAEQRSLSSTRTC